VVASADPKHAGRESAPLERAIQQGSLIVAAVFAFAWAIVRASVQAITQDEGDTYFWFASQPASFIWHAFPNNHVLNTALIWITTRVFGLSSLSLRMPALLGAAIYIAACYFLSRSLTDWFPLRLPLLICLIYNPFIFDFMAAARGYSLATAFLTAAIAIPVWYRQKGSPSLRTCCAFASASLGLSFAATFSFALVDTAAFLALLAWVLSVARREQVSRVAAALVLPGFFVVLVLCGYPLTHWPKGELYDSALSLREMTHSLIDASFYQLNPRYLVQELYDTMDFLRPMLLPALVILCACQLVVTIVDGSWREARARWVGWFATGIGGIVALTVLLHWLAFHFHILPLPMTRTAIFLIPLTTLFAGAIAASPARTKVSQWMRQGIAAVFICLACYFLLCFRMTYFKEYQDEADMKDVYAVLARLNHTYGVTDAVASGLYVSPLNFYRVLSNKETLHEFTYMPADQLPAGKSIYVLHGGYYRALIEKEKLAIIYRGKSTDAVVAVRPDGPIPAVGVER
jgi:hypothetical protein